MPAIKFPWCIVVLFALLTETSKATLIIGGLDSTRVGPGHLGGDYTEEMREAILAAFPGATFKESSVLSPGFLQSVDVVIVGAPSLVGAIALSSAEQNSLLNFVKAGGGALVYSDNDDYGGVPDSDNANETFLDPFGVDSTGKYNNLAFATVTDPTHPVTNGLFGQVSTFSGYYPGWFDGAGPYATPLATYDGNGEKALLAIAPGALVKGSGGVVLLSDADMLIDSADGGLFGLGDNQPLILNSIAFVSTPEPSVLLSSVCGLFVLAARRRRTR